MKTLLLIALAVLGIVVGAVVLMGFAFGKSQVRLDGPGPTPTPPALVTTATPAAPVASGTNRPAAASKIRFGKSLFAPAPPGTAPTIVDLQLGQSIPFTLSDGSARNVTLKSTKLVHSYQGTTVWATATVEVSGPGVPAETAEIPAAYFPPPSILNGVRVYVAITKEFNDGALRDGGGTSKDARLVLSDARYTLTDVSQYRWPFPNQLWQQGSRQTYWQSLQGSLTERPVHHGGIDLGMPKHTPIHAWERGTLSMADRGSDKAVKLSDTYNAQVGAYLRQLLYLDEVSLKAVTRRVEPGDYIGRSGRSDWWHTHLDGSFEVGIMAAEWYIAHASPVALSYIQDWLVAGPYNNADQRTRLSKDYLGNEGSVEPGPVGSVADGQAWKLWDNLVPGVVAIGETLDPYPFSGWAWANGNFAVSAAYLATYVYTDSPRSVVFNVGSSDAVKVWLGKQVILDHNSCIPGAAIPEGPTIEIDQHKISVRLQAGWNRILVKVAQLEDCPKSWQLSFRVSDDAGQPIPDLLVTAVKDNSRQPAPTATPEPTSTPTPAPTATATPVPTATAIPTATPKPAPTPTAKPVFPPFPVTPPTATPTPKPPPPPTPTPKPAATPTPKPKPTATTVPTPTPKPTATLKPGPKLTPEAKATSPPYKYEDKYEDDDKDDDEDEKEDKGDKDDKKGKNKGRGKGKQD